MFRQCQKQLRLAVFTARNANARRYVQQSVPRTPRSAPKTTTSTKVPLTRTQVKNRSSPSSSSANPKGKANANSSIKTPKKNAPAPKAPTLSELRAFRTARLTVKETQMSETEQVAAYRAAIGSGQEPWTYKAMLYDLIIPPRPTSFSGIRDNTLNFFKNAQTMFLLATDMSFPGKVTTWRYHPQLLRAKSTGKNAWVAPFRTEFLDIYQRLNRAVAEGDRKVLTDLTAYEYRDHALGLLQRGESARKKYNLHWELTKLLSPVQIVSIRGGPLYFGREEPATGSRNIVQALVKFDTLQTLTRRDSAERVIKPDGSVAEEGYTPEARKVREYLVFENRLFFTDGWYVRGEIFEGIKPKFGKETLG